MRERSSQFASARPVLPLALALGLHLLLVLAWLVRPPPRGQGDGAETVSVLIPVLAPRPHAQTARPVAKAPAERARSAPAAAARKPSATAPPSPAAEPAAGAIDRELRGGRSGVPKDADTPWGRFQRALVAAHIERSITVINDRYTAADGVTIYRSRQGQRATCYITGSVGVATGGFGGSSAAGAVPCPRGVSWERY